MEEWRKFREVVKDERARAHALGHRGRERHTQRQIDRDRHTDTQTHRQTHRQGQRQTDTETEKQKRLIQHSVLSPGFLQKCFLHLVVES